MSRPVVARLRSGSPVAGWLCKANPEVWDVESHLAAHGRVDRWRLMHGYRAELITPGQPFVLWLTGPRSGVIAVGTIAGRAEIADDGEAGTRPYCAVDAVAVDTVPKSVLLAEPGFEMAEVVRTPRAGNPLALSPAELDLIAAHLPTDPWVFGYPERPSSGRIE